MNVEIHKDTNHVVITLPIDPKASASGKTVIIAGTGGFKPTSVIYEGKVVSVSVNVCIPTK